MISKELLKEPGLDQRCICFLPSSSKPFPNCSYWSSQWKFRYLQGESQAS